MLVFTNFNILKEILALSQLITIHYVLYYPLPYWADWAVSVSFTVLVHYQSFLLINYFCNWEVWIEWMTVIVWEISFLKKGNFPNNDLSFSFCKPIYGKICEDNYKDHSLLLCSVCCKSTQAIAIYFCWDSLNDTLRLTPCTRSVSQTDHKKSFVFTEYIG